MYKYIVMHCGYAEDYMISAIIFQTTNNYTPPPSTKLAIIDLALDLYVNFNMDKGAKLCSKCGNKFIRGFDYNHFLEFVRSIHSCEYDSYNYDINNWSPFYGDEFIGAPKKEIIFIPECAEHILLSALLEAKPNLKSSYNDPSFPSYWESICKKKAKKKQALPSGK